MKDFQLPVTLENTSDKDALVCLVPAHAESGHDLLGKFLTDKEFLPVALVTAEGHSKPTEDDKILVVGPGLSLAKIQRYLALSTISIVAVGVKSSNGDQLGIGFAQRTHDAVTEKGYQDVDMPEIGDLVLKKADNGNMYAEHDFVSPYKSGPFDSLLYLVKAKTKVDLVISAKYVAITNPIAPASSPIDSAEIPPISL